MKQVNDTNEMIAVARQAAHDIRSPLSALNMMMASLPDLCDSKRQLLKDIVHRINSIAENLLVTGREFSAQALPQAFQTMTQSESKPAFDSLEEILASITAEKQAQYAGAMNVSIKADLDHCPKSRLTFGSNDIKRVVSNLVNNSVEAGASHIEIRLRDQGAWYAVEVVDNGCGFEATSPCKPTSNGLGLTHAHSLVTSLGGRIEIDSKPGESTSVRMILPNLPKKKRSGSWRLGA